MSQSITKSDALVVQEVLSGERDAFSVLVRRYMPAVHALAFAHTGNHADADDVVQETFLKAYTSLDTLREASRFGSWVATISKNTARSVSRKRVQRAEVAMGEPAPEAAATSDVEARELRELLKRQIEQLDESHREVLLLHYFTGMSAREIAGILGVSRHAVHKRLQRARNVLSTKVVDLLSSETEAHRPTEKSVKSVMGVLIASPVAWETAAAAHETFTLGGLSVANMALPSPLNAAIRGIGRLSLMKAAISGTALVVLLCVGLWLVANRGPDEFVSTRLVVRATPSLNAEIVPVPAPVTRESTLQESPSEQASSETASSLDSTVSAEASGIWAVRGEVLNEVGSLVAGARVDLELVKWYEHRTGYDHEHSLPDRAVRWTSISDDLGAFGFERLPLGDYQVAAYTNMELGMSKAIVRARRTERVFVQLRAGGTIAGVVQTANSDTVSGAHVSVFEHVPENGDTLRPARSPVALNVSTGPNGVFILDRLWPGMWRLRVQATGHPELVTDPIAPGTWDATLTLSTGAGLKGDVVLAVTGEPVAQAVVTLKPALGVLEYSATSDDTGAFGLENLPAGSFSIEVAHAEFKRVDGPGSIDLLGGGTVTDVRFVLAEGASILGRIYDEKTGEGIAGVLVGAESTGLNDWGFGKASAPTTESGEYRISGLDAGEYRVTSGEALGYPYDRFERSFAHKVVSVGKKEQVEEIDFALLRGVHVVGKVVDEEGRPVEGVVVEGTHRGVNGNSQYSVSGEDGVFELWVIPPAPPESHEVLSPFQGSYFRAREREGGRLSQLLGPIQLPPEGLEDLVLMLEDAASVSGYVVDGSGRALAGAQVIAYPQSANSFGYPSTIADVHGRFALSEVDAGSYSLRVRRLGARDTSPDLEWVNLKSGQSLTNVRLTYDAGLSISGFVTDSTGTPIVEATIYAHSLEYSGPGKHTLSDRNGVFKIGGLVPGSHRVGGSHPEYARTELLGVPSGTNEHHIVLEEAAVLEEFITLDGSPLQGVRNEVRPVNAEHRLLGTASSNEVGTFELRSLPAGEVVVRSFIVTDPGGEVYIDEQRVPLESGAVTELHLEI